jgi:hypothetical protein
MAYPDSNPNFKLYTILGKLLLKGSGSKVDFSEFKKGIYFIMVENLEAIKIIKEYCKFRIEKEYKTE